MSEWNKLWEGWGGGYYNHPPIYKVKEVGDKMQGKLDAIKDYVETFMPHHDHKITLLEYIQSSTQTARES